MSLREEQETALTCWKPSRVRSPPATTGESWAWRSAFLTMRSHVALVHRFPLLSASTVMVRCLSPQSISARVKMLKYSPKGQQFLLFSAFSVLKTKLTGRKRNVCQYWLGRIHPLVALGSSSFSYMLQVFKSSQRDFEKSQQ